MTLIMIATLQTEDVQLLEEKQMGGGLSLAMLFQALRPKEECELKTIFTNLRICLKTPSKKRPKTYNNQLTLSKCKLKGSKTTKRTSTNRQVSTTQVIGFQLEKDNTDQLTKTCVVEISLVNSSTNSRSPLQVKLKRLNKRFLNSNQLD